MQVFDCRTQAFRTFGSVKSRIREVSELGTESFFVTAPGERIQVLSAGGERGKKVSAKEFTIAHNLNAGTVLGT